MPFLSRLLFAAALLPALGRPAFADEAGAIQAYGKGVDQLNAGDWSSAASDFRKAVQLKPDYAEAYDKLGVCLFNQDRQMEAVTDFKMAVAIDPRLTAAWYDLGQGFESLDRDVRLKDDDKTRQRLRKTEDDDAVAAYRKALEVRPGNDVAAEAQSHYRLGVLLRDRAMRAWALAHGELPGATPSKALEPGQANLKEAMLHLEAANALNPDFPENRNELGRLYDIIGRYPEAIEQYDQAVAEKPDFAAAYSNRGVAWWKSGNWDRALADTLHATRISPAFAGGHYNFAEVLYAHVQVLRINPTDADQSLIHLEAGRAIAEYRLAVDLDPALMPAWYGLARAYRGYFDFADAEKTYGHILDTDKRQRQARLELKDLSKQEAGFVSHIPREYRPTPTPNPGPAGN